MHIPVLSEDHISECRKKTFTFILLVIIIVSIYSNTFHSTWHFDDISNILDRQEIRLTKISYPLIKKTFFLHDKKMYRPVANLSLAINYYFSKENVFGYHLINILIHIIASFYLFLFIYHILRLPYLKQKYGQNAYPIALLATLLWAINPIQTQAITYIVQRMASMAAMFYIMSMYFYLKARISKRLSSQISYFCGCVLCGFLAFGSKENSAMLPIMILLFELLFIQKFNKKAITRSFFIFLIFLAFIMIYSFFMRSSSSLFDLTYLVQQYSVRDFTLLERLLTESRVIIFYITLLFYPMPNRLCIAHDISLSHGFFHPISTLLSVLLILSAIVIAIGKIKKWPLLSYCILFFFINHLIESTIVPLELIFEHRNYLPSMLFFVPIAILAIKGMLHFSYKKSMLAILTAFIILVMIGYGHSTFVRNYTWKTEESLWLDAIDKSPHLSRPHMNLGLHYFNTGRTEKAIQEYHVALTLRESALIESRLHYNLSSVYVSLNQDEKAVMHLKRAIETTPVFFLQAYNNLALTLIKQRDYKMAFHYLSKALTVHEKSWELHHNLGLLYLKEQHFERALTAFQRALELNNNALVSRKNLGVTYKRMGDLGKSILCFREVLAQAPRAVEVQFHLAESYFLADQKDVAERIMVETLNTTLPRTIKTYLKGYFQDNTLEELPDREWILPFVKDFYCEIAASM